VDETEYYANKSNNIAPPNPYANPSFMPLNAGPVDPVYDFVQNINQQLPYLQNSFQEQLQILGNPVAAARAVLGSLR
jgi:hypothetical protein